MRKSTNFAGAIIAASIGLVVGLPYLISAASIIITIIAVTFGGLCIYRIVKHLFPS